MNKTIRMGLGLMVGTFTLSLSAEEMSPAAAGTETPVMASTVKVETIAVGAGVENRQIVGEAAEFDASVSRVYCLTKVSAENVPSTVNHVWYADDKKISEVPLSIKYPTMRTWSYNGIWPAKWKVEVTSETGEVLSTAEFMVKEAMAAPAEPAPAAQPN